MEWLNYLFPVLLICGLFGIIFLVGIGFSYLWLVWLGKEATRCPECGRRGAGELVESQVINSKVHTEWRNTRSIFRRNSTGRELIRMTESTYEDHFECQYCGHQWTKTAQERKRQSSRENEGGRQR